MKSFKEYLVEMGKSGHIIDTPVFHQEHGHSIKRDVITANSKEHALELAKKQYREYGYDVFEPKYVGMSLGHNRADF